MEEALVEEAFFNKDFWRQLVAVFVGAFLGFGVALLTGALFGLWRHRTLGRVTRQVIVTEAIRNLRVMGHICDLTQTMRGEGFEILRSSGSRLRAGILQQFMTVEPLDALSEDERKFLVGVTPQLASLNEQYDDYERLLRDPGRALTPIDVEGKGVVAYREMATDRLLGEVARTGSNLLEMLIQACRRAEGQLIEQRSKDVASKLEGLRFGTKANYGRVFKSSLLEGRENLDTNKWLVVWEHDWPKCPMPVIELRSPSD